jgi:hypothetical protein
MIWLVLGGAGVILFGIGWLNAIIKGGPSGYGRYLARKKLYSLGKSRWLRP